jgi:hypothetical protein
MGQQGRVPNPSRQEDIRLVVLLRVLGNMVSSFRALVQYRSWPLLGPKVPAHQAVFGPIANLRCYSGVCLSSWTVGSSLIGIGLTAGQACGVVLIGCVLASASAFLNGTPGAMHHLGYGAMARASWGLFGSYFCVMLNGPFRCSPR